MLCLDSGAFSIWSEMHKKGKNLEGKELIAYIDRYAEFVYKHKETIDIYINVDIPFSPEQTWKNQQYLEKTHKLKPLPVFHPGEDFKWLRHYVERYDYIGIGVMGASTVGKNSWISSVGDRVFDFICDTPDRLPKVKTHAFAAASPEIFVRYPWMSIDSASWVIYGKYGGVIIPKKIKGNYDYTKPPYLIKTSWKNHHINIPGTHINNVTSIQREEFLSYFAYRNLPIGKSEFKDVPTNYKLKERETWFKKGKVVEVIVEEGLCNSYRIRDDANLYFFLDMEKQVKPYPWPWFNKIRRFV